MKTFPRKTRVAGMTVAILLGLTGWAIGGYTSAPGAEQALADVERMIDSLEQSNRPRWEAKVQLLEGRRKLLLSAIENPGPEPTPEAAILAARDRGGRMEVDTGEVECEPIRPFTDGREFGNARCVSLSRARGDALFVFLTSRGTALVIKFLEGGVIASDRPIPTIARLPEISIAVDASEAIRVAAPGEKERIIQTADW